MFETIMLGLAHDGRRIGTPISEKMHGIKLRSEYSAAIAVEELANEGLAAAGEIPSDPAFGPEQPRPWQCKTRR